MALTIKFLEAMNLTKEQIDAITDEHVATINGLKAERDKFRTDAERLADVEKELETLKTSGGDWQSKYEQEHDAFESFKNEQAKKDNRRSVESQFRQLCLDAGISEKRLATVLRASAPDMDSLELDEEGHLKESEKLAEKIKSDWSDFIVQTNINPTQTQTPPQTNPAHRYSAEEIKGMSAKDINANWDAIKNSLKG